jgi:dimethylamine monooxygenase subunit B
MSGGAHGTIPVRVTDVAEVSPLVRRFRFETLDARPLPAFSGGAHILVELPDGGAVRRNAYSLMSSPRDLSTYVVSVRRDDNGRGGSRLMHHAITPGAVLNISRPVNLFQVAHHARKHLMIAGGIGITPFLAMAEQLLHDQEPFELHYAVRSVEHGAYVDDVVRRFGSRAHIYVGDRGQRLSPGVLLRHQPLGTHLYVCGPSRLIDAVVGAARELGWPASALHLERFTAPPAGKAYQVKLARSGQTISVGPNQSMLEAIEAAGVDAPYLCRGGACGQCEARVLACEGTLVHADHYLSEAERASGTAVMPCVSRFEGKSLVLDL